MAANALCPLGQSPILPIRSAIHYFKEEITCLFRTLALFFRRVQVG